VAQEVIEERLYISWWWIAIAVLVVIGAIILA
jgi:hypothetical protein